MDTRQEKKQFAAEVKQQDGSAYDQLFYPFLFAGGKADLAEVLAQVQQSTLKKCQEVIALRRRTLEQARDQIIQAGVDMAQAFAAGATLFAFGNGGSATDAQDLVADLMNPPFPAWKPLPAISLTNDVAVVTAVGNDVGFDNVFNRQIIALAKAGDIAFGISTSGNSKNAAAAFEQAKRRQMLTVALAGYDGGEFRRSPHVDCCITSPSDYIPRIQEAHATVYHALLEIIQFQLK